ncbi:hypothetical protein BFN03_03870 [Rhodococcus sp. WMMA185]|uniref:hypothetical protein n=1 Tax=Rhodococcus sp. WMMA185 TaxID=679318 RepID=UPI000878540B|nr:hypothetical protein [Rhodococcus sp. WMMA185]AOW92130.1 hypothetical protein BFN03_03870 [Rhodococcus sp. WMMA185]
MACEPGRSERSELSGLSRQERLDYLRRRMAAVPARGESMAPRLPGENSFRVMGASATSAPSVPFGASGSDAVGVLPVPTALAELLPRRGLTRGSVVAVSGAASLLLGLVASVTAGGGHVAVIGHPRLGILAAVEMGARLERLALIPDPGADPVEIAAVLLDGMDLVVLGLGGASVAPSRARAVVARARSKGSTLVVTDGHWDGVEMRLDAQVRGYTGLGNGSQDRGCGRLRALSLVVCARGRAFQPCTTRLDVRSEQGRVQWVGTSEPVVALEAGLPAEPTVVVGL